MGDFKNVCMFEKCLFRTNVSLEGIIVFISLKEYHDRIHNKGKGRKHFFGVTILKCRQFNQTHAFSLAGLP